MKRTVASKDDVERIKSDNERSNNRIRLIDGENEENKLYWGILGMILVIV